MSAGPPSAGSKDAGAHDGDPHHAGPRDLDLEGGDPRRRIASLAAVILGSFGVGMAFGVGFPLTGLTLEAWNTPKWLIGVAGAAPALGVLTALPFLPRLVRRWGVVRAIAFGCVVGGLCFAILSFIENAYSWIVVRFVMSAGLALPWLAGETWINLVTREETRGRVIALYAISFFSGYTAGPLILDSAGVTGALPFLLGGFAMMLAGLPIVLAARLAPDVSGHGAEGPGLAAAARLAPIGMLSGLISGFAEMSYLSLIGNVGIAGGLSEGEALRLMSAMTFGGVVLQFAIGWLADKSSRTGVTIALQVLFIALSLVLPFAFAAAEAAQGWAALLPFAVAFLLGGVVLGFYTVGLAIVGEEVPAKDLAAANAAFLVTYQLGAIIGPIVAGGGMSVAPVHGFVAAMAALMGLALVAVMKLSRNAGQHPSARAVAPPPGET